MKPMLKNNCELSLDKVARINAVLNHDYTRLIERVRIEHQVSTERAQNLVGQWSAFIALNLVNESAELTPPMALDLVWHSAILNTKDYREFCNARFGRFVDHVIKMEFEGELGEHEAAHRAIQLAKALFKNLDPMIWSEKQQQQFVCSNDVAVAA
jgi:hypothetical protein